MVPKDAPDRRPPPAGPADPDGGAEGLEARRSWSSRLLGGGSVTMEERVYRLMTLVAAFTSLCVILPTNLLQHFSPWLHVVVGAFGLANAALFVAARRGFFSHALVVALLMAALDTSYFLNGGSFGSVPMVFFLFIGLPVVFARGQARPFMFAVYLANGIGLILAGHFFPGLVLPFASADDRFLDMLSGYAVASTASALITWVLVDSNLKEKARLASVTARLKESVEEAHRLRGLLRICAWCGKVRTEEALWEEVAGYLAKHSEVELVQAFCPACEEQRRKRSGEGTGTR
ncbi:MAG: hypothetical protein QM765_33700 [Myxococcales bacterium]